MSVRMHVSAPYGRITVCQDVHSPLPLGLYTIGVIASYLARAGQMARFIGTMEVVDNGVRYTTADSSKHRKFVRAGRIRKWEEEWESLNIV